MKRTWETIEESYNKTKEGTAFSTKKNKAITWISKYMDTFYSFAKNCDGHIAEIGVNTVVSAWCWAKAAPKKITLCDTRLFERANSEEDGRWPLVGSPALGCLSKHWFFLSGVYAPGYSGYPADIQHRLSIYSEGQQARGEQ